MSEQPPQDSRQPQPGWYADPRGGQELRWWDGSGWTAQTQPMAGSASGPQPMAGSASGPQPLDPGQRLVHIPPSRRSTDPWPLRHKALSALIAVVALLLAAGIGSAAAGGSKTAAKAAPAPAVTVTTTQMVATPGPTVTATATATATATVQATANSQGEATQISSDGVYVVGQDIPGGTWHSSGGSQCYEATLSSTNTEDILDNNNFTGPDTISLAGAKALDISGGCTWNHE